MAQRHRVGYFLMLWGVSLVVGVLVGLGLLFATSFIPRESIAPTVQRALATLEDEGLYPQGPPASAFESVTIRDNFSDSVFLNVALMEEPGLAGSLSVPYWAEGSSPLTWLSGGLDETLGTETPSPDAPDQEGSRIPYPRYWHGYLVYLRPLLATGLPYETLRLLLGLVVLGLFGAAIAGFAIHRLGYVVPLIIVYLLMTTSWLVLHSLQYANGMLVGALACFVVSLNPRRFCEWDRALALAMAMGVANAFVDLLTFPLVPIGAIVILLCAIRRGEGLDGDGPLLEAAYAGSLLLGWACAWASMWAAKWCVGSLVLDIDVIADAIGSAQMRAGATTANGAESIGRLDALRLTSGTVLRSGYERGVFFLALVGYVVWDAVERVRARTGSLGDFVAGLLPFLCVALAAVLWCVVLDNHTYQHIFMTYRVFTLVPLALLGWLAGSGASLGRSAMERRSSSGARHLAGSGVARTEAQGS